MWEQLNRIIKPNGAICLFGSEPFSSALRMSNIKNFKYDWVWNKKLAGNGLNARRQPLKIHENIMVFNTTIYNPQMKKGKMRKKMTGHIKPCELFGTGATTQEYTNDLYFPQSIIEFSSAGMRKERLHPTQKPVSLLEYLIHTYTKEGETVLDFTMGSGSTGVACINTNRNFIGMELDEKYFEIAQQRIEEAQKQT